MTDGRERHSGSSLSIYYKEITRSQIYIMKLYIISYIPIGISIR